MMKLKSSVRYAVIFVSTFCLYSCGHKIIITREYIYSTSWAAGEYQGFEIAKIKLLDSTLSVYDKNFNHFNLDKYSIDSNFCFHHFTGDGKYNSKSFFNQHNKNLRWRRCGNLYDERETIGLLELNTWYVITGLKGTIDYYVYIDKEGQVHTYSLGPTNW
ncbi:MAG: hypothetical protein HZA79_12525 [Sphingobacteriales bacterium]|nr:hypothetical protein [Sphingobacteriales bacterium]